MLYLAGRRKYEVVRGGGFTEAYGRIGAGPFIVQKYWFFSSMHASGSEVTVDYKF